MIQEITLQRLLRWTIDQGVTPSVIGDRLTLTGDDRAVAEVEPVLRPFRDELARLLWWLLLDSRVDSAVVMGEPRTVAINRIADAVSPDDPCESCDFCENPRQHWESDVCERLRFLRFRRFQ